MKHLKASARLLAFVILTLPLMPVQHLLVRRSHPMARRLPHRYHRLLCRLFGIAVRIEGETPPSGPALIVSNHVSWLDIVVLSAMLPVAFVAKREVSRWPLFGALARLQRTVFVDRNRRHAVGPAAQGIIHRLQAGETIVLFGEGTSHDGASVLPFRSSLFAVATPPDIAIVPVTLAYRTHWGLPLTRRQRPAFAWYGDMNLIGHLWSFLGEGPVGVSVIVHPCLPVDTKTNRKKAAFQAEMAVRRGLEEALHGRGQVR